MKPKAELRIRVTTAVLLAAALLALVGCGSSSSSSSSVSRSDEQTPEPVSFSTAGWPELHGADLEDLEEQPIAGVGGCAFGVYSYEVLPIEGCENGAIGTVIESESSKVEQPSCEKKSDGVLCTAQNGTFVKAKGKTVSDATELLRAAIEEVANLAAPVEGGSWTFQTRLDGGYEFEGSLTLGEPRHAVGASVGSCSANSHLDAEMPGELILRNATPDFPAEPGIEMHLDASVEAPTFFAVSGLSTCSQAFESANFYATSPLTQGEDVSEPFNVVIYSYYSPEYPDGDSNLLEFFTLYPNLYNHENGERTYDLANIRNSDNEKLREIALSEAVAE